MKLLKKNITILLKFFSVGSLGSITNLLIFYISVDLLNFNHNYMIIFAFLISVSQNYFLNSVWTFREKSKKLSFTNLSKYVFIGTISLASNLIIFNILTIFLQINLQVIIQAISIVASSFINFLGAKWYVFK